MIKIDAEGAEGAIWDGSQETLRRFPDVRLALDLHIEQDPPQARSLVHQLIRSGWPLRHINYDGDIAAVDAERVLANPCEHWMLWLQK